jgi:hypothetical protein
VHQVGHYPELHQDARSTKHKIVHKVFRTNSTLATSTLRAPNADGCSRIINENGYDVVYIGLQMMLQPNKVERALPSHIAVSLINTPGLCMWARGYTWERRNISDRSQKLYDSSSVYA